MDQRRNVLVVEDDPDFADGVVQLLAGEGYRTAHAACRQDALDVIRFFEADVVIVDVRLGSEDGVGVMNELKALRPHLMCLVMTAHGTLDNAIAAVQGVASDYFQKPFEPTTFLASVERCFETLRLESEKRVAEDQLKSQALLLHELNVTLFELVQTLNAEGATGQQRQGASTQPPSPTGALLLVDEARRLTFADERFRELTGWRHTDLGGEPINEIVHPLSRGDVDILIGAAQDGQYPQGRLGLLNRAGEVVPVAMRVVPMFDWAKGFRGVCMVIDIEQHGGREIDRSERRENGDAVHREVLTARQAEVLAHALRGGSATKIASAMGVSDHTVRSHLKAIYRKLDVGSRAELAARVGSTPDAPILNGRHVG